ncbi:hypothetical protein GCM10018952_14040 [Streptosporangium vulgare]
MRRDPKTVLWLLALSIVVTFSAGGATVLSGHLEPVPDRPAPPDAAPPGIPAVPATPTPPPQPQNAQDTQNPQDGQDGQDDQDDQDDQNTAAPANSAGPETPSPVKEPLLLANGRQQPLKVRVPRSAKGRYAVAPGEDRPPRGKGKVIRYAVEVERGLPFEAGEFAAEVHRILNDRRGWGYRFKRVARGPVRIRVSLSQPRDGRPAVPADADQRHTLLLERRARGHQRGPLEQRGDRLRPGRGLLPRVRHQPRGRPTVSATATCPARDAAGGRR